MIKINAKLPFENILFIGDPHLSSTQISKRNDPVHLSETILNKMQQAAKISHEIKAYPVILGDLFDNDREHSIDLLTKTIRVFKEFYHKPITIVGNHEKTESHLIDNNMTSALVEAGLLDVFQNNKTTVGIYIGDDYVEIGGTNYGSKIPDKVDKNYKKTSKVIWITHHDLMFKQFYPGSIPLFPIQGVDLVVNGHMHGTQPQVQCQTTTWCCPGNITRQRVDMIEHIPSVWAWNPEHHNNHYEKLIPYPLDYIKDIFKKNVIIDPNVKNDVVLNHSVDDRLKFIDLVSQQQNSLDSNKTSDKDLVKTYMDSLIRLHNLPEDLQQELYEILENVTHE